MRQSMHLVVALLASSLSIGQDSRIVERPIEVRFLNSGSRVKADEPKNPKDPKAKDAPQSEHFKMPNQPSSNKVEGLELPADLTVQSKQRAVVIEAKAKASVRWLVTNSTPKSPVASLEVPFAKSLIVFPNDNDDTITVFAYTAVNNEPSEMARTVITVKSTGVGTTEAPPPSPPMTKAAYVTLVVDYTSLTTELKAVVDSQKLRDAMEMRKIRFFVLPHNSDTVKSTTGLPEAVTAAGGPPAMIIQDKDGNVLVREQFKSVEGITETLNKTGAP